MSRGKLFSRPREDTSPMQQLRRQSEIVVRSARDDDDEDEEEVVPRRSERIRPRSAHYGRRSKVKEVAALVDEVGGGRSKTALKASPDSQAEEEEEEKQKEENDESRDQVNSARESLTSRQQKRMPDIDTRDYQSIVRVSGERVLSKLRDRQRALSGQPTSRGVKDQPEPPRHRRFHPRKLKPLSPPGTAEAPEEPITPQET